MLEEYKKAVIEAFDSIDKKSVKAAYNFILDSALENRTILVFGNGGSCSLSQHLGCDMTKGIFHNCSENKIYPNVISLGSNIALLTAIANDYGYEHIFSEQIKYFQQDSQNIDILAISASGNSPNIIDALQTADYLGYRNIMAWVGFDGGKILKYNLANCIVHVKSNNYGIVEDCHQMMMHMISQEIRKKYYDDLSELKL